MAGGAHGIRSFVAGRENTRSQDFSMENFLPNFLHIFSVLLKYTDPPWLACSRLSILFTPLVL